jgi:hypothetical protein
MRHPFVPLRRLLVVVFALILPSLLMVVRAPADPGPSTSQRLEAIRRRMEQGQGLYIGKSYDQAAQVFEDGYATYPYSAFLFNAGVCYQKLDKLDAALLKFRDYLRVDPNAPDAQKVTDRIAALEAALAAKKAEEAGLPEAGALGDAGVDPDAGLDADGGAPVVDAGPPPTIVADDEQAMKSLVVVETEPPGAPLKMYQRLDANAAAFVIGGANAGWKEVAGAQAPANFTLAVGRYHVVVEKFRDFNVSHTDIDVQPGHVHQFKANLSQGQFMAFLRIAANIPGAYVFLDDTQKQRPVWGNTPHGELVPAGKHEVLIEAPGFQPLRTTVDVKHGEQREVEVVMARLGYGIVRLRSNTDVSVKLDGVPKGDFRIGGEPLEFQAPAGQHKLEVTSIDRKDLEGMIDIPKGQVLPIHATMIQRYPRGGAWTQAVVGAALLGGATVAGLQSNRLYDELSEDRQAGVVTDGDSRATAGRWLAVGSNVGFVGGAVLVGLATYNFIKDPLPESSSQIEKAVEFDDPMKAKPTALAPKPKHGPAQRRAERAVPGRGVTVGGAPQGLGVGLGARF